MALLLKHSLKLRRAPIFGTLSLFKFSSVPGAPAEGKKFVSSLGELTQVNPNADMAAKIENLEKTQPFFDRIIFFDPDVMASLPGPLQVFDPIVEASKNCLLSLHDFTGLPWWAIIAVTCCIARVTIMPLIYVQMRRFSKLTYVSPVLVQVKKLTQRSHMQKIKKWSLFTKISVKIARKQQLKALRLFLYNFVHFPIIINLVWTIRRLLVEDDVKSTAFLWIPSLAAIDPYYILPFATVAGYYWNLQRFITPENQHTLISRIKNVAQVLLILWLPILCNWPSGIVLYMFSNAVFSIIQTSIMVHPEFMKRMEPKMMLYQFLLKIVEYDKTQSQTLIDSIKSGEESYMEKAIKEEVLVEQTKKMLENLEKED